MLFVSILALASCGQEDQPPRAALCVRSMEEGICAESVPVLEAALKGAGYQLQILDAANDQSRQNAQIQELIAGQVDLLLIEPVMVSAAEETAKALKAARIPCIFLHRQVEQAVLDAWDQSCYIGPDDSQTGMAQTQILTQLENCGDLNGDGIVSYVYISGPEADMDAQQRAKQSKDALENLPYPSQCLQTYWGDWSRKAGQHAASQTLAVYGKDAEVILCASDEIAVGALEGIQDGGRTVGKDIYLAGIDGIQHALVLVHSQDLSGTAALDLDALAEETLRIAQRLLKGKKTDDRSLIGYVTVTQENIDAFME